METPLEMMTLLSLGDGVAEELFGEEFHKVLENMLDINTPTKSKRVLKLIFTFLPNEDRNMMNFEVHPETKLAPTNGYASQAFIGRQNGIASAKEYRKAEMPALFEKDNRMERVK